MVNIIYIDPTEHANIYQSTNDVIPTALTVAVMKLLQSTRRTDKHSPAES